MTEMDKMFTNVPRINKGSDTVGVINSFRNRLSALRYNVSLDP